MTTLFRTLRHWTALLTVVAAFAGGSATALNPGDILVADTNISAIFRVDPRTGDRTILSSDAVGSGPRFSNMGELALDGQGFILVPHRSSGLSSGVLRVDPTTGDRTLISGPGVGSGPPLSEFMEGIAVGADGQIYVTKFVRENALVRIDPATGDRTIVSSNSVGNGPTFDFYAPAGLALAPDGRSAYVSDVDVDVILKIDLATGDRTLASGGGVGVGIEFNNTRGVAIDAGGGLIVADNFAYPDPGRLMRVDLATGNRTTLDFTNGPSVRSPQHVAGDADGTIVFSGSGMLAGDFSYPGVFRFDPATGSHTVISAAGQAVAPRIGQGPPFENISGVAIVPRVIPEPATFAGALLAAASLGRGGRPASRRRCAQPPNRGRPSAGEFPCGPSWCTACRQPPGPSHERRPGLKRISDILGASGREISHLQGEEQFGRKRPSWDGLVRRAA